MIGVNNMSDDSILNGITKPSDLKKLSAATVIFCFVLLLSEILILAGDSLPFNTGIFSIVLSILSLAVYVFCLRKFCRK